ncbi:hypothetical protein FD09_GL002208 [Schleiferilactobacillus perolens DSM 12744]|uniref:Uncharacterized protein n=2 Tax=Schleiferilactobacillus perolens TaxID=100468 RepID=A0A0R1MZB6_9LACO|nr:hypothetical protein FD09_GL002208 [Schleiferilactobacillus perolens DSM 12744]
MQAGKRRNMKRLFFGVLCAALVGGFLFAGSAGQVSADTIGDILNNGGNTVPVDNANNLNTPWNMYQIPGLYTTKTDSSGNTYRVSREHGTNEGSFVANGTASSGMPLSSVTSDGTPDPTGYTGANPKNGSPANIQFTAGDSEFGTPWYSVNYVDKPDFLNFGSASIANNFPTDNANRNNSDLWNPSNVVSKMTKDSSTGKDVLDTAKNQSFNGGYLKIAGNVPIRARIAVSRSTINSIEAGNWGVMARLSFPKGVDVKALASSVAWDKSYFYLTLKSYTFKPGLPLSLLMPSITVKNMTFPLQFDHHIYLDKAHPDSNDFFLKVKGMPFGYNAPVNGDTAQMQLAKPRSDALDYLHNRYYDADTQSMKTLDNLDADGDNDLTSTGQPEFQTFGQGQNLPWDPWYAMVTEFVLNPLKQQGIGGTIVSWIVGAFTTFNVGHSPVYATGLTGRTMALLNGKSELQTADRATSSGGFFQLLNSWFVQPFITSLVSYFIDNPFPGTAHINFTFDMSKYATQDGKEKQALTMSKLFPSPYADGEFNKNGGVDSSTGKSGSDSATDPNRRSIGITMYDSNQLVDPYSVIKGKNTDPDKSDSSAPIYKQLQAGTTPTDYALVNDKEYNNGRDYPVYTNFSSWTGAIVPYDRMHWTDDSDTSQPQSTTYTDTLHSEGKLGSDINNRTATPDPAQDGILVNDGKNAFRVQDRNKFVDTEISDYLPKFGDAAKTKFEAPGAIRPQRYANVYQFYDYSKSEPTPLAEPAPVDYDNDDAEVQAMTDTNVDSNNNITGELNNKRWNYTGTLKIGNNTLPLADASIGLKQSLKPTIDLSAYDPIMLERKSVTGGKHEVKPAATFRDPLAIEGSPSDLHLQFSAGNNGQQDSWNNSVKGEGVTYSSTPRLLSGDFSSSNDEALDGQDNLAGNKTMTFATDGSATSKFAIPHPNYPNAYLYYGYAQIIRKNNLSVRGGYNLSNKVDGSASDDGMLILDNNEPEKYWYTLKKQFTNGDPLVHFVQSSDNGTDISVTTEGFSNEIIGANYPDTIILMAPKIAGVSADGLPQVSTSDAGNSAGTPQLVSSGSDSIDKKYYSWKVKFTKAPKEFKFTYKYKVSDWTQIPLRESETDIATSSSDSSGGAQQALGVSNGIEFNALMNANLIHVPTLDFGTHNIPGASGTGNSPYPLKDNSTKTDAYFTVRNTDNNTSSWTIWDTLDGFTNEDHSSVYDNFTVKLGQPQMLNSSTNQFVDEPYITDPQGADPSTFNGDQSKWRFYNHYPFDLISSGHSTQMYHLDRVNGDSDNKETNLTRYYPNASLSIPANVSPTITSGKYTANITYLLSDNGTV